MNDTTQDLVILKLDRAKQALAEAKTIQQTKTILDIACAAEIYAKRQQLSIEAIGYASDVRLEALRLLGQMLRQMPKAKGGQPYQERSTGSKSEPVETLADLGIDKKISMMAQRIADLPQAEFELLRAGKLSLAQVMRAANTSQAAWSIDAYTQRLIAFINSEIDAAPPETTPLIIETSRGFLAKFEEAARPELRDAVSIARDELSIRDAEPGGYRMFHLDGAVIGGVKSTHADWYRGLTTHEDGVTTLKRKQVEARLDDIDKGKLPTTRTALTHFAVMWAIKDLARTSPLSRGGAR